MNSVNCTVRSTAAWCSPAQVSASMVQPPETSAIIGSRCQSALTRAAALDHVGVAAGDGGVQLDDGQGRWWRTRAPSPSAAAPGQIAGHVPDQLAVDQHADAVPHPQHAGRPGPVDARLADPLRPRPARRRNTCCRPGCGCRAVRPAGRPTPSPWPAPAEQFGRPVGLVDLQHGQCGQRIGLGVGHPELPGLGDRPFRGHPGLVVEVGVHGGSGVRGEQPGPIGRRALRVQHLECVLRQPHRLLLAALFDEIGRRGRRSAARTGPGPPRPSPTWPATTARLGSPAPAGGRRGRHLHIDPVPPDPVRGIRHGVPELQHRFQVAQLFRGRENVRRFAGGGIGGGQGGGQIVAAQSVMGRLGL